MLRFLARKPCLGIELTGSAVRMAMMSGCGVTRSIIFTGSMDLPDNLLIESYASPNITDMDRMRALLGKCVAAGVSKGARRAALSLPDSIFRVQSLEFDELPPSSSDRERLIRWRLEKGAASDIAEAVLRYQVLPRQDKGYTVLACIARQAVIDQYEALLLGLQLEPWAIGLSSLNTLNYYASSLEKKASVNALAYVTGDTFATIIMESGGVRFYRFKDVKRGSADDVRGRLVREIDDSIHFYMHADRSQQSIIKSLYLAGDTSAISELADELRAATQLEVEMLVPASADASGNTVSQAMAAAMGAGGSL